MNELFVTDVQIASWSSHFLWPMFRIAGFFAVAPIFGARTVPLRVRAAFTFIMTIMIAPVLPEMPNMEAIGIMNMLLIAEQMSIGITLGLVLQMLFQMFVLTGQTISMQAGLGFASMIDPSNGVSVATLSQWYLTLVTLLFLAINGHLVVIEVLIDSFYIMPIGSGGIAKDMWMQLANFLSWMFKASLTISLPAITSLLLVNLTFGILTRAAPQLNVFSLGFPVTMICGIGIILLTFNNVVPLVNTFTEDVVNFMHLILER
ncbi:MAG: flagellar biosynthetic protein FliR [Saccharospirillaceae bacterium]|nr:flagellar biosynthetic protein FliR [Pseudomonadales bacterium]NRB77855.1 flagellar biosynthetic protein FliR [Saccharospirillaceae bacterium]